MHDISGFFSYTIKIASLLFYILKHIVGNKKLNGDKRLCIEIFN